MVKLEYAGIGRSSTLTGWGIGLTYVYIQRFCAQLTSPEVSDVGATGLRDTGLHGREVCTAPSFEELEDCLPGSAGSKLWDAMAMVDECGQATSKPSGPSIWGW